MELDPGSVKCQKNGELKKMNFIHIIEIPKRYCNYPNIIWRKKNNFLKNTIEFKRTNKKDQHIMIHEG